MIRKAFTPARRLLWVVSFLLAACDNGELSDSFLATPPKLADATVSGEMLRALPPAEKPIVVSVYDFADVTGQYKPSETAADYSRAVTQGGAALVSQALYDTGRGSWFTVLERNGFLNLAQERKIIRATRDEYMLRGGQRLPPPAPLLYAGMLIEGGIVAYESNVLTGGAGARYLGIGGNTEYRRDVVTVYLRAVNVSNGQVVLATNASKTIFSTGLKGSVFKYVGVNELLELESGFTLNEPPQFAVRQAIEMAVYSMVMEGTSRGLWSFADRATGQKLVSRYFSMKQQHSAAIQESLREQGGDGIPVAATPLPPQRQPINGNGAPGADYGQFQQPPVDQRPLSFQQVPRSAQQVPGSQNANGETPDFGPSPYGGSYAPNGRLRPDIYCDQSGCYPLRP